MNDASTTNSGRISWTKIGLFVLCVIAGFIYARIAEIKHLQIPPLLWFTVGIAIGIVVHEAGHAVCAVCTGMRIRLISIGIGPLLISRQFGETRVDLRLVPSTGIVQCYPQLAFWRLRALLFILGGVLGNLLVVGLIAVLDRANLVSSAAQAALIAVVVAQVALVIVNLVPFRVRVAGMVTGSDGLQLLCLFRRENDWTRPRKLYREQLKRYSGGREVDCIGGQSSDRIFYQLFRPDGWTNEETRSEVQDALLYELERGDLLLEEEMLVLDALITYGLIYADSVLRVRIDEWSLRALRMGRDIPTLRSTRGAVLVTLGRYAEGISILSSIQSSQNDGPFDGRLDTFMNHVFSARAHLGLGDRAAANASMEAARAGAKELHFSPVVPVLLADVEREIGAESAG